MLFQSGATNRLGAVEQGTTVADWDEDEQKRQMSLAAAVCHAEWQDRKLNLIDAPGDPGFQADSIAALRVVEGALFVLNGVNGVEVQTTRLWDRSEQLGLSRVLFVNMLDRERADFFVVLDQVREQFSKKCVAVQIPIGHEHELKGIVDLFHMRAYMSPEGDREGDPVDIPEEIAAQAASYREQLVDAVVETDEALMERYLEEGEVSGEELAAALKNAVSNDDLFPVLCGSATKNLGTTGLLDLLVEGVPSPAKKPLDLGIEANGAAAFVWKTVADPFAGRINVFRVLSGSVGSDSNLVNPRTKGKERFSQLLLLQGKEHSPADVLQAGDIGAVA
jgi:elongation factor G